MNKEIIKIISIIILLGISNFLKAQDCVGSDFCNIDVEIDEYDFRAQSFDASLSPGDTSRVKFVAYAKQDFTVVLCNDPALGNVQFRILEPTRKSKKVVTDTIITPGEIEYQMDEDGYEVLDDNGDPIVLSKGEDEIEYVYGTLVEKSDKVLYDNTINDKPFWRKSIKKTKRLIVEIIVPEGDPEFISCVSTLIGRKFSNKTKFYKNRRR